MGTKKEMVLKCFLFGATLTSLFHSFPLPPLPLYLSSTGGKQTILDEAEYVTPEGERGEEKGREIEGEKGSETLRNRRRKRERESA